jgi:hypothetical protein
MYSQLMLFPFLSRVLSSTYICPLLLPGGDLADVEGRPGTKAACLVLRACQTRRTAAAWVRS